MSIAVGKHRDILSRALAYHEAGHQVIAHALGVPVGGMDMQGNGGHAFDGLAQRQYFPELMSQADWDHFRKKALILLAGEAAERLLYEDEGNPTNDGYWSATDRVELDDHLRRVFGEIPTAGEYAPETLLGLVDHMVLRQWKKVGTLALALMQSNVLSASEVEALLQPPAMVWGEGC